MPEINETNALEKFNTAAAGLDDQYSGGAVGRGVVICAGGPKFFVYAWVCINMLRQTGCKLPIELWHLGPAELTSTMRRLLSPFNVRFTDAYKVRESHPVRMLYGWELKPYAIIHSHFSELILLDADNMPLVDPIFLFDTRPYKQTGAIFWPDRHPLILSASIWRLSGVSYRNEPSFESGQIVIDKRRCWKPLMLTMWMNEHSDFWYHHVHGDKETFHICWRKLKREYAMTLYGTQTLPSIPGCGALCQHDFSGRRIFQHRKWTLDNNQRIPGFSEEQVCLDFIVQLRERWTPAPELQRYTSVGKTDDENELARWLIRKRWMYERIRHDVRAMEFLADGMIGEGAASQEVFWDVYFEDDVAYLDIRSDDQLTCRLHLDPDRIWRGRGEHSGRLPIELTSVSPAYHIYNHNDCGNNRLPMLYPQNHRMPLKTDLDRQYGHRCRHFVHSGTFSDPIYALPAIKGAGGGVLWMDEWYRDTKITAEMVTKIKPLLMQQPYIVDVRFCTDRPHTFEIDLNLWRDQNTGNVCFDHLKLLNLPYSLADQAWLVKPPKPEKTFQAVINRTLRNHNPAFPWKELYARYVHDTNAVFLGLPEEHAYFQKVVGRIIYLPTSSLINAAAIVAWSTVFIGNESLLLALATGMQNADMNRQNGPLILVESNTGKADFSRWNRLQCSENAVSLSSSRTCSPSIQPDWVTAVIICKGRLKNLQASLPAALRCGCQVIVVDAECPEHCGQWAQDAFGSRVMVINHAGPFDRSKALNAGLQLVNTPLTMILDADVVLWPEEFTGVLHVIRPGAFYCHRHTNGMQGWVLFPTGAAQYDTDFTGYGRRDCDFLYQLKTAGLTPQTIPFKFANHIRHPDEARVAFYGLSETESFRRNNARMLAKWGHTRFEMDDPINQPPQDNRPRIRRLLRNNRC